MRADLEQMATALRDSGDYQVLRRLIPRMEFEHTPGADVLEGIVLDSEATGLNVGSGDDKDDEIIELGMIRFSFDLQGRIHRVLGTFDQYREPQRAELSTEITTLTGITQEMVAGRTISEAEVEAFIKGAVLIIGHNAAFDRVASEAAFPIFKRYCWACSYTEIPWKDEGFSSARLGDLLTSYGYFFSAHKADRDCLALLELLAQTLPRSGDRALKVLLDHARQPTYRVAVSNIKGAGPLLRKRGFHWTPASAGRPGKWVLDVSERQAQLEAALLAEDFHHAEITITHITAYERFSARF